MKKAFSILEIIIVIVIVSITLSFAVTKFDLIKQNTNLTKLKADIALIQNGITTLKKQRVLQNNYDDIDSLDEALSSTKDEKLFSKILQYPLKSTNAVLKEKGFWFKKSSKEYVFVLNSSDEVLFKLENSVFSCIKPKKVCEELY